MSTNSYEAFYDIGLVVAYVFEVIGDQDFRTPGQIKNLLYFIQADFIVTFNRRCFKEDMVAFDYGFRIQKPFVKTLKNDFSKISPEHKMEMIYIIGQCIKSEKKGQKIDDLAKSTETWKYFINHQDSAIPNGWFVKDFPFKKA